MDTPGPPWHFIIQVRILSYFFDDSSSRSRDRFPPDPPRAWTLGAEHDSDYFRPLKKVIGLIAQIPRSTSNNAKDEPASGLVAPVFST
jgi:hypothetical protein